MDQITDEESAYLSRKGKHIRSIKEILDDLHLAAFVTWREEDEDKGLEFQLAYSAYLIGLLDAAVKHYYLNFIGRTRYDA